MTRWDDRRARSIFFIELTGMWACSLYQHDSLGNVERWAFMCVSRLHLDVAMLAGGASRPKMSAYLIGVSSTARRY